MDGQRARRRAFHLFAGVTAGLILVFEFFLLLGLLLLWLPDDLMLRVFDTPPSEITHRLHSYCGALVILGVLSGVAAQLWRPERRGALVLQALAWMAIFAITVFFWGIVGSSAHGGWRRSRRRRSAFSRSCGHTLPIGAGAARTPPSARPGRAGRADLPEASRIARSDPSEASGE